MIMGFVIWSIVFAIMLGIGIWSYRSEKPVGFFTGTKPPEVKDAKKYNIPHRDRGKKEYNFN